MVQYPITEPSVNQDDIGRLEPSKICGNPSHMKQGIPCHMTV